MNVSEAFARFDVEQIRQQGKSEKTSKNYQCALRSILTSIGDIQIEDLTKEHIVQWRMYMDGIGNSPSYVHSNLNKIRCVLRYLIENGYEVLDPNRIKLPKLVQKEVTYLEYGDIQKIVDATENLRDKAIIASLFATGCRISELLNLNRDDIVGNEAMVLGKGSKYRPVYFDGHALSYIEAYLATRKDKLKPLFISGQMRRITVARVQQIIHVATDTAGIDKNVTPHVFRHSYATDLLFNGADLVSIKGLLGHTQINTTMRYLHVTDKHKKNSYERYHSA